MHGGRWAIAGFLYQILGSLGYVGHVAVTDANYRHDKLLRLQLSLEPQDGGDLTVESSDGRIVEQFKLRESGRRWSASEIIDEVFPDLLRDVFTSTHIIGTRYRFTTNGRVVAQPLRDLLAEIGRLGPDVNPLSVLDNSQAKFRFRQEWLTARSFFTKIMQASGCCDGDAKRLWNFLYRFEINDLVSEQSYLDRIDKLLSLLVDDRNTIDSTRDALLGQLLQRARAGETVTPVEILSTANLNWNIPEKRNQIRARLREQTNRTIASEQYDRSLDARASAPPLTENWFTVLTGESGQGKTWQLLRLAHDYIEQDKLCAFLRDIQSIEALEKALLNILWHQSGHDNTPPLGNALERIADVLPKAPEPLLTVFLDDVQNRDFAVQLLGSDFNQLPLHFVLTAQSRVAAALKHSSRGQPHIIPIDRFTLRELRNYLLKQQIDWAKLPSDVLELLKQPILAKLYVDIAQEGWIPETEYALLDRYWRHATIERREQDDHPQDAVALKALAMKLFDGIRYPWPQKAAREVGLTDDVQLRLISVGLIRRDADQRIALFHDRLLNWVVAKVLAERVLDRDLSLERLREMFLRILRVDTGWCDDNLVSRLGYVPMDVLWLLAESIPPDQIADLVNEWVREDRLGGDSSAIFSGLLATWGGRILPALEQFAVRHLSTEDVWTLGSDVAKGIVVAGAGSAPVLQPLMTRLIASDDLSVQRVGLTIAATVPLPDQIERIWALHRIYGVRRVEMEKFDGALEDFRYKISLDALVNVAGAYPDWVERKIRAAQNEDDLVELVYLMMKLKREIGAELWGKTKEYLFARLPAGHRCLSQVIGHFRDESCIDWLSCIGTNDHEIFAMERRFDALVRLAPDKALEFLKMMSTEGPFRSTKGWWLRLLIQKLGEPAQLALRRFFDDGKWTGVRALAILFQGDEDLVDDETLTLIIDTFEARLEDHDHVEDWQFTGEGHFLRLLSKIRSPRLLRLLESKRGSRFEELLARRAIRQGGRTVLKIKPDALEYSQLLLKIGGEGIAEVIANDLSGESHWARSDALKRVQWSPTPKIRSRVLRIAQNDHHEKIEEVPLMEALASLEEDAAFAEMLRKGMPAYLTALQIRRSKSPIPKAVRDQACSDALSADENTQHSGITILSLCKGRKVTRCLQRVLETNGSDSRAAHEAIWALDQIGHCSDQILPLVTRMIKHQDSQLIVFNYLLHHGGPEGEAVIADYLANHNRTEITIEDQVARILVSRGKKTGSAASFLRDIVKKRRPFFDSNTNLSALSEMGDRLADDLLFENAIAERSFSGSPTVAIEAIAIQDPEYAFEAAARLLERDAEAGGEEILLSVDAKRAICFILRLLEQDIGALSRWRIYRHLRWLAPHSQLAAKLREMAKDDSPRKRELACEILGWLPPEILGSCLEACANDIERNVEQAAIEALKKRQEQRDVEELLSEMATADGPARWSRLYAILDLFDPHTLARREDPLCIWPVLDRFPYDFTMEAETILKQHVDQEKQKAGGADRRRRNH